MRVRSFVSRTRGTRATALEARDENTRRRRRASRGPSIDSVYLPVKRHRGEPGHTRVYLPQISTTDRTHARTGPDTQRAQAHNHTQNSNTRTQPRHTRSVHTHTHTPPATLPQPPPRASAPARGTMACAISTDLSASASALCLPCCCIGGSQAWNLSSSHTGSKTPGGAGTHTVLYAYLPILPTQRARARSRRLTH